MDPLIPIRRTGRSALLSGVAYARFGSDSDVYIFSTGGELMCQDCSLNPEGTYVFMAKTTADMLVHLDDHREAGHKVSADLVPSLLADQAEHDVAFRHVN